MKQCFIHALHFFHQNHLHSLIFVAFFFASFAWVMTSSVETGIDQEEEQVESFTPENFSFSTKLNGNFFLFVA